MAKKEVKQIKQVSEQEVEEEEFDDDLFEGLDSLSD